jgi:AmiR/NasT family two-component response regulator
MMSEPRQPGHLRVLIADQRKAHLAHLTSLVAALGHTVIAEASDIGMVAELTSDQLPDVAIVCLDESSTQALHMIRQIVRESACPVIALLDVEDADFINQAAQIGIFAYIVNGQADRLQSAFDVALRRFAEYHGLEGAFTRRAITERAKGILMERHQVDQHAAFQILRDHSRHTNTKLVDVAQAVTDAHPLLPPEPNPDIDSTTKTSDTDP